MARQIHYLTDQEVGKIVTLLDSTNMSILEIAERMECSRGAVMAINRKFKVRSYDRGKNSWVSNFDPSPQEEG